MVYRPGTRVTLWLKLPVCCTRPTWVPSGASGLPAVKPLPLPAMPAEPFHVHGEPVGLYAKAAKAPVPTFGVSKPPSWRPTITGSATRVPLAVAVTPVVSVAVRAIWEVARAHGVEANAAVGAV